MSLRCLFLFTACFGLGCAGSSRETAPHPGDTYIDRLSGIAAVDNVELTMHGGTEPSSDVVSAPVDSVWMALPVVYEQLGVPAELVDRRARQLGNRQFNPRRIESQRLSRYIECGYGVTSSNNADVYRVTMSLLTRISATRQGGTLVQTVVTASARPREVSGTAVRCGTKGVLERRIAELVMTALGREVPWSEIM